MDNHIGNNIKKIAEEKNLKPQEIAYRWKKSPQAVYDLFIKQYPKCDTVIEMSRILKVSILDILGVQDEFVKTLQENDKNESYIDELRNQIKIKDKQIEFLQKMIEDLRSEKSI